MSTSVPTRRGVGGGRISYTAGKPLSLTELVNADGAHIYSQATKDLANTVQKAMASQASRALACVSYFVSGCIAINASQFMGVPMYLINQDWYNSWIALTKQSFGLLTMTMTQWWAPTLVRISGDESVRGQLMLTIDGKLVCDFPERLVLIANHQIYTDWLYLWWIAYANGMHGRIYIILKESLKRLPIVGWGMQFNQFIFLKRNWEQDRPHMTEALQRLNNKSKPMWLLLFPEGTNLAPNTRERSQKWAEKNGIKDYQHQLVPRTTGLQFCLQNLRETTDYVYDCTIAYEGVPRGQYAQDIFTINRSYFEARPPKSVNMYWRRFEISKIPVDDTKLFDRWLRARWQEKDWLIEGWYRHGKFPADTGVDRGPDGKVRRGAGHINTQVKAFQWYEFLQVFAPAGVLALVLYMFYGALPKAFVKSMNKQKVVDNVQALKTFRPSDSDKKLLSRPQKKPIKNDNNLPGVKNPITIELNGSHQKIILNPKSMSASNIQDIIRQVKDLPTKMPQQRLLPRSAATSDASSVISRDTVRTVSTRNTSAFGGSARNAQINKSNEKPKNRDVARVQQAFAGKSPPQKKLAPPNRARNGSVASSTGRQDRLQAPNNPLSGAPLARPSLTRSNTGSTPKTRQPPKLTSKGNGKAKPPVKHPTANGSTVPMPQKNQASKAAVNQNAAKSPSATKKPTSLTLGAGQSAAKSTARKTPVASVAKATQKPAAQKSGVSQVAKKPA